MNAFPAATTQVAARPPLPVSPRYALEPVGFSVPSLAECARSAALGGDREIALAALMAARLMIAALPPIELPEPERAMRAVRAKSWLSALTMPQPARMALIHAVDASSTSSVEATASLRELIHALTGHLTPAALDEIASLAERLRLYYEQTP